MNTVYQLSLSVYGKQEDFAHLYKLHGEEDIPSRHDQKLRLMVKCISKKVHEQRKINESPTHKVMAVDQDATKFIHYFMKHPTPKNPTIKPQFNFFWEFEQPVQPGQCEQCGTHKDEPHRIPIPHEEAKLLLSHIKSFKKNKF